MTRRPIPALRLLLLAPALLAGALGALGCASASASAPAEQKPDPVAQARARYEIAVNHLGAGRIAFAIREFQAAEKLNPKDPWTQHGLAEAFRRRGMYAEAEQHLRTAIRLEPGFQAARLNLSALYIQMERYPEAIAEAQVLMADPTFPAPWQALSNIGFAQMRLGQRQEARASLVDALEFEPDFWRASLNLGILEAEEGNSEEAIALFQRVLAAKPGGFAAAEANYRIAEIHTSRGRPAQAKAHLTAALGSKPSGEWGKRSEEALRLLQ